MIQPILGNVVFNHGKAARQVPKIVYLKEDIDGLNSKITKLNEEIARLKGVNEMLETALQNALSELIRIEGHFEQIRITPRSTVFNTIAKALAAAKE